MPPAPSGTVPVWHALGPNDVLAELRSSPSGLDAEEAARRLASFGENTVRPAPPASPWRILAEQFRSVVVWLLVAAIAIAMVTGDPLDAAAITVVLILNAALGFLTELRARRAIEALSGLVPRTALVVRDGHPKEIEARRVVPGDVLVLEEGRAVPADARLIDATGLRVSEAPLTGESTPVAKQETRLAADTLLADRTNMVYGGTVALGGAGRAVVVATGMTTEVGRIGGLVASIREGRTPLEVRLDALGRSLVWIALAVSVVVALLGLAQGLPPAVMISTGLALAVAAVPEGLPAVATIALAVGVWRMARRRALVRRLPSVESLGSVTVVCTDKTGTLTAGEMTATKLWVAGQDYDVSGTGYAPEGVVVPEPTEGVRQAVRTAILAGRGDATLEAGAWVAHGDPTDVALLVLGRKLDLGRDRLLAEHPEVAEVPFSSERRFMATFHRSALGELAACVKGAPARVLAMASHWLGPEGEADLDERARRAILSANDRLAGLGLRVLGLAAGPVASTEEHRLGRLVFLGLVGLIDPPAPGVRETVATFARAGIRTVMITGDQRRTAEAIGRDLALTGPGDEALDGRDLDRLDDEALAAAVGRVSVFSRVSPKDKLRIVSALQARGEVVATLGDGVNDAAALKKADVGVAMGGRGTDVAREAADVVLQDDWFPTIGAAIEEGRVIFDNIRKFVFYLFSCNLAEILVLLGASAFGLPLPLTPLQILWLNLVTDTFPALALALEPAEPDLMRRPPRDPRSTLLSRPFARAVGFHALTISASTLGVFFVALGPEGAGAAASTMAFMTLALTQLFHLGNARSRRPVVEPARAVANRYALGAVVLVLALQVAVVSWAPLRQVLGTSALDLTDWVLVLGGAAVPAVVGQTLRLVRGGTALHDRSHA